MSTTSQVRTADASGLSPRQGQLPFPGQAPAMQGAANAVRKSQTPPDRAVPAAGAVLSATAKVPTARRKLAENAVVRPLRRIELPSHLAPSVPATSERAAPGRGASVGDPAGRSRRNEARVTAGRTLRHQPIRKTPIRETMAPCEQVAREDAGRTELRASRRPGPAETRRLEHESLPAREGRQPSIIEELCQAAPIALTSCLLLAAVLFL